MSGNGSKPSIPAWQRVEATPPSPPPSEELAQPLPESPSETSTDESTEKTSQPEDSSLLQQASRFLENPSIRDAPREKKVTFLQSKGVSTEDINSLLGEGQEQGKIGDMSAEGQKTWSKTPATQPASKPPPREVPPIVTYPEFLAQPSAPPPLITTDRIMKTAYISGGLAATLYGLSKYIVTPMTENLTQSRHDFAQHVQNQLSNLNSRLGNIVSVDPANKVKATSSEAGDVADCISEADSDPTELFHRDFGTQTSPSLSRRPSISDSSGAPDVGSVIAHTNRLKILTSHIRELGATQSSSSSSSQGVKTQLTDLSTYLSEMSYQNTYYTGMGGLYTGSGYGLKLKNGKDDQIEACKADIRAVKGVLLSSRNFPSGGRTMGRT
ncbi:hypothetical protein GQ43DRAFT_450766 [Delitschia confertaspora ATCC 74209]|uniref:Peroxisomal membrane protein PEX14 n=1 Tax=Delitschia confertaspora ATCC 74209 TaxID=1513339 RepID=A0A9P4JGG4_9PLEO|nr:hypothetical protein GQ43DRAFT_450766 [Delitschia confertaspora ATCC 74209]